MDKNAATKHRKREEKLKEIRRDAIARRNALANRATSSATRMGNDAQTLQMLSGALSAIDRGMKEQMRGCPDFRQPGGSKELWASMVREEMEKGEDARRALKIVGELADLETRYRGKTALMMVSELGLTFLAKFLVEERGALVDAKETKTNRTALILAAKNGNPDTVGYLLEKKANPNAQDSEGWTALMFAVMVKNFETAMRLLKCTDSGIRNKLGETALMIAATYWDEGASLLLAGMPKGKVKEIINMRDNDKRTALMRAAMAGHEIAITEMRKKGADLNIQDKNGLTLLDHMRANRSSFEISMQRDLRKKGAETKGELELDAEMRAAGVSEEKIRESRRETERMRNLC